MNCKGLKYYYLSYKKTAWANFHITPMNTCQIKIYKLSLYTLVQNSVHGFCKYRYGIKYIWLYQTIALIPVKLLHMVRSSSNVLTIAYCRSSCHKNARNVLNMHACWWICLNHLYYTKQLYVCTNWAKDWS